jgi:hypothetical protein
MQNQKEQMEEDYKSYNESVEHACAFRTLSESGCTAMLSRAESRLERTFSRALRNLLQLRQDARKNDSEKRTESQDRSPAANHQRHVDAQPPIEQSGADDRFSSSTLSPTRQATKNDGLPH